MTKEKLYLRLLTRILINLAAKRRCCALSCINDNCSCVLIFEFWRKNSKYVRYEETKTEEHEDHNCDYVLRSSNNNSLLNWYYEETQRNRWKSRNLHINNKILHSILFKTQNVNITKNVAFDFRYFPLFLSLWNWPVW